MSDYLPNEILNETVFEEKRVSLKATFQNLRENLNALSAILIDLPNEQFETASEDLQANELDFEQKEEHASRVKLEFDKLLENKRGPSVATLPVVKPKFKPKDLTTPKWDGNIINYRAWKMRIAEYFNLTGLNSDNEQLAILLYEDVLPQKIRTTLQDCISVDGENGVWERLDSKIPLNSIPRAILKNLKETRPMSSDSA